MQFTQKQKSLVTLTAIAAVVIAIVIQVIGFIGATGSDRADTVIAEFIMQDAGSTTVYQQQVNALWAVKDMLRVVADESANQARLQGALIVLQVILIGLVAFAVSLFVRASASKAASAAVIETTAETEA